jgi:hypothetical protein
VRTRASIGAGVAGGFVVASLVFAPVLAGADPVTSTTTTTTTATSTDATTTTTATAPTVVRGSPVSSQIILGFPVEFDPASGDQWHISNTCGTSNGLPSGGTENGSPGLGISDAATSASGNAYDCAAMVWIGNSVVADADGLADLPNVPPDSLLIAAATVDGLDITQSYRIFQAGTARTLVELQNPTAAAISTPVSFVSNFGSDAATVLAGSSSGGGPFTTADRWIVTADDPVASTTPINTTVLYGPGAVAVTPAAVSTTVFAAPTTDGALATFDVTVPAGQTRYLMFFQVISGGAHGTPNSTALDAAAVWNQPLLQSSPLLAGIPATDTALILNWAVVPTPVPAAAAPVTVVPTFTG